MSKREALPLMEQYGISTDEAAAMIGVAVSLMAERIMLRVGRGALPEADARTWGAITAAAMREITDA